MATFRGSRHGWSARTGPAALVAALLLLAQGSLAQEPSPSPSGDPALRSAFERADTDRDGKLSESEASKAGFFTVESFGDTDQNRDGTITLFELGAAMNARFQTWIDRHARADSDRDGRVSKSEAASAGSEWGETHARADRDADGWVSHEELMTEVTRGYFSETTAQPVFPNIINRRF